jgi:Mrp family chromosome partitioning ATPase
MKGRHMERIKKALDLARAQRAEIAQSQPTVRPAPFRPCSAVEPAPPGSALPARTRTVSVDASAARRGRVLPAGATTDPSGDAFKILRTQVLQRMKREGFRSLAIVSPGRDDGKTLTAINLGISIAEDPDHTALIVDMDLRRPSVHRLFGITLDRGIEDCLSGGRDVGELLVQPQGYPKLVLLPGAAPVQGSSELLSSARTRHLVEEIVQRYSNRVVVFDLPPLLATDDALAFLPLVDAALLVVFEGRTRREDVTRCLELMRNTPVIGTLLNGSREPVTAYN